MTTPENGRVTRRGFARTAVGAGLVAGLGLLARAGPAQQVSETDGMADTILRNGRITTLDRTRPQATALAIKDGLFAAVGEEADVMALQGEATRVVDLGGRRVVPGLNDSHTHVIRGGLHYNLELRWEGVPS